MLFLFYAAIAVSIAVRIDGERRIIQTEIAMMKIQTKIVFKSEVE